MSGDFGKKVLGVVGIALLMPLQGGVAEANPARDDEAGAQAAERPEESIEPAGSDRDMRNSGNDTGEPATAAEGRRAGDEAEPAPRDGSPQAGSRGESGGSAQPSVGEEDSGQGSSGAQGTGRPTEGEGAEGRQGTFGGAPGGGPENPDEQARLEDYQFGGYLGRGPLGAEGLLTSGRELRSLAADADGSQDDAESRLAELRSRERAGRFSVPRATGDNPDRYGEQVGIAREEIVARPVEPIPARQYELLYRDAAREYGFAGDWDVLAAVGKVESNHGENMGPSSAGALGPMQFLPSTWQEYGVDGNEDGEANIMDPEDAIPAAARYLAENGAPEDWYRALYTYNRSGAYVRDVLAVAEGYRQLARDGERQTR